jgi:uncharacterized damage-inducible protein DinB
LTAVSLEEMLAISQNINLSLLQAIADEAWSAKSPGGKGRGIAQLFAHIHNVRLMWLVAQKREGGIPEKADGDTLTKAGARKALEASAVALRTVIREAAQTPEGEKSGTSNRTSLTSSLISSVMKLITEARSHSSHVLSAAPSTRRRCSACGRGARTAKKRVLNRDLTDRWTCLPSEGRIDFGRSERGSWGAEQGNETHCGPPHKDVLSS